MFKILVFIMYIVSVNCDRRILVLSGGGSHGAFEAGVVGNLVEQGIAWDEYTGVSAGSLNAMFLSFYTNVSEAIPILKKEWVNLKTNKMYKSTNLVFPYNHRSLLDNKPYHDYLINFIQGNDYHINMPLRISATSLKSGNSVIFSDRKFIDQNKVEILMASSAIPLIFPVVEFENDYFVDGGEISNICIEQMIVNDDETYHLDIVTASPLITASKPEPDNLIYLVKRNFDIIKTTSISFHFLQNLCDYSNKLTYNIYTPVSDLPVDMLDFDHGLDLITIGNTEYTNLYYDCKKINKGKIIRKFLK